MKRHKTNIAWLNLIHAKTRFIASLGGISFAIFLIFMQLGFFGAVGKSATLIYDNLNFDILLISRKSLDASVTQPISISQLYQANGVAGVKSVMPFYIGFKQWRNVDTKLTRAILIMGFNPKNKAFANDTIYKNISLLKVQNNLLIDKFSRPEYGDTYLGMETELGGRKCKVVGYYKMGTALRFDGSVIMSDQSFINFFPGFELDKPSLGLIKINQKANVKLIAQKIRNYLPENIEVLTRNQAEARDRKYWITSTSVGYIFGTGAIMGFIVGAVIIYQALYSNVLDYLQEYATLKAIGYSNYRLTIIVFNQALYLAILAYIISFILALIIYFITYSTTRLPIFMTIDRAVFVATSALFMSLFSTVISLRKLFVSNPADLF